MRVYLDTSILVALLTYDPSTSRADAFFLRHAPIPVISDFAVAEFASALGRRVRMGEIAPEFAQANFIDRWIERVAERIAVEPSDVADASTFLRRLDLTLRTPDALNIALCRRAKAMLATFDTKMATAARALGIEVMDD